MGRESRRNEPKNVENVIANDPSIPWYVRLMLRRPAAACFVLTVAAPVLLGRAGVRAAWRGIRDEERQLRASAHVYYTLARGKDAL